MDKYETEITLKLTFTADHPADAQDYATMMADGIKHELNDGCDGSGNAWDVQTAVVSSVTEID